jgi:glycosyltransferase 2 family protein
MARAEAGQGAGRRRGPSWLRLGVQVVLTVTVTLLIASRLGVSVQDALALERAFPDPRALLLALSFPVLLAAYFLATRYWGWMSRELGAQDPGAWASFRIVMVANVGRYLPGKVWPLAGLAVLSRRVGIPASTGAAAGILVQAFSLAGALVVAAPALRIVGGEGEGTGLSGSDGVGVLLAAGFLLAALVGLASLPRISHGSLRILYRIAGRPPDEAPRPGPAFGPRWVLLHVALWVGYGVAFALFLAGLGFHVPTSEAVPAFTAAYLLGYVAFFAPAGIGIREGFLIALLHPSLGSAAAAVAVLARLWMTAVELIPAGLMAAWEFLGEGGRDGGGEGG